MSLDMGPMSFEGVITERFKKRQGNAVSKLERPIGKARRTDIPRQYLEPGIRALTE